MASAAAGELFKAPNSKLQAPEKLKTSSTKPSARAGSI
jgi:hypothetical protein